MSFGGPTSDSPERSKTILKQAYDDRRKALRELRKALRDRKKDLKIIRAARQRIKYIRSDIKYHKKVIEESKKPLDTTLLQAILDAIDDMNRRGDSLVAPPVDT